MDPGYDWNSYGDSEPGGSSSGFPSWTAPDPSPPVFGAGGEGFDPGQGGGGTGDAMPGGGGIMGGGMGGDPSGGMLSQLAKALGMMNKDGSPNWMGLASLLGPAIGGALNYKTIGKASNQMTDAIKQANQQVTGILGGAQAGYQPYMQLGQQAVGNLSNMHWNPLAPQYKPLGAGNAFRTLGQVAGGK